MALTEAQHRSRDALDYRLVSRLPEDCCARVFAYSSRDALQRGEVIAPSEGEAGRATHYLAELRFPILVGSGPTTEKTLVTVDVSVPGYPFRAPNVQAVSRPLPWSPHVEPHTGVVCIGEAWRLAHGKMTVCDLVAHVCRVLNCDEPDRDPSYTGWNGDAVRYWREVLKRKPLNAGLRYPVLPVEITHGVSTDLSAVAFEPVVGSDFSVVTVAADGMAFSPVGSAA